ncbi:unnamed protein product [Zymoseptoria tritici ST99CH_3D7]|uniref:Uncharacterized protein n=1 Tax=Zymoseptoria tritici (strain ST99CH_3D7) TaxID=1276538 RepID=A0A1X7RGI8_ZYMT9|nr:unnamed protein product [Zymoseptoria tritici ST99CH_3D7]
MDKTSSSSIFEKKGYAKTKISTFYHKVVKPAFPEAITDIKILHGMTALERRVKHEINDASLYPEVVKVAQVRRSPELCPEEHAFLVKRKQHVGNISRNILDSIRKTYIQTMYQQSRLVAVVEASEP